MLVDPQLFQIIVAACGFLAGWLLKAVWDEIRALQAADAKLTEELSAMKVLVAGEYIRKSEFEKFTDAIFVKLDKIAEKLDSKIDKSDYEKQSKS
jgi:hypothetical protein